MKSTRQQRNEFYDSDEWKTFRHEHWSDLYRHERERVDDRDYEPVFYCTYCEKELSTCDKDYYPTLDHMFPLHSHWEWRLEPKNITLCCNKCNKMKGGMDPRKYPIRNILIRREILLPR